MIFENKKEKIKLGKNKKKGIKGIKSGFFKKALFFLYLAGFLIFCFWLLIFSPKTKLKIIFEQNENFEQNKKIEERIKNIAEEKYLKLIKKDHFLTFPKEKAQTQLLEEFKLIKNIIFKKEFPNRLKIEIEERKNYLIWCGQEQCGLFDEDGEVFLIIPRDSRSDWQKSNTIVIEDQSNLKIEEISQIAKLKFYQFCQNLPLEIKKNIGLDVENFLFTPSSVSEEILVKTKAGWGIYFSTDRSLNSQILVLKKVLEEEIRKQNKESLLDYIDLRIKGRVVYKLKVLPEN